ncbi:MULTISPECIES: L-alanine exporter AlaE [unclassified Brenneria]|uniref:L-alanine exporter AlaE n=1 Tax=unclassified Brenneria TaxID=2634434 RepID=UPI0015529495|nr:MULTISPECIES: L-alanine exporter AlaE [unclassified Brenneria]MBJ7222861.1 L-alanine exporter AlaE [Brenneria sp. L3-3C-1]MEE3644100.1 L-alanine exporter AlaE [Brenneria sp. L3_3C_1]MEE3651795.1 L-alanine exporter AlaE [Brenneria sp. HEZEL_4_2_4]NPD01751.1 L-alanine exporter AlaE [Brenneria sp. hezel4-2-4]
MHFSPTSRLRSATADTFALVIYCFITGMVIEIGLSGMSFEQSFSSRLLSIPVNIVIAWPYGIYRDRVLSFAKRHGPRHFLARNLADLLAYVSFQSPVYAAILWTIGADSAQILTAVTSNAAISMAMGVLYGYFLEYCRRLFRVAISG